jgi:carbonic anhydrase/acetyltransferase-like protein (isoleucine patch superfamily)
MLKYFKGKLPVVHETAFVGDNALLIGDITVGAGSSVWYGVNIRADINRVIIGADTNIQENAAVHVDRRQDESAYGETRIGDRVTIGHGAIIHGCTIEDECLIGMGAIILTGAVIGSGSIVAAGALVKEGQVIPPRSLVVGIPAVVKGTISDEKVEHIRLSAQHYVELGRDHKNETF